jgi:mannosyltransferase OCH1-like enzyme
MNVAGIILFLIFFIFILVLVLFFFIGYKPRTVPIPLKIFQTWETKDIPGHMKESISVIIKDNPEFEYFLFDDTDCRNYIEKHYDSDVLGAYDSLVPGAYKADLWRYCVLYKEGGIYIDIKFKCYDNFKLISLTNKEYFVRDYNPVNVYNGFMVCGVGCKALKNCIDRIVINVRNKYYGMSYLHPTGPALLAKQFSLYDIDNFELSLGIDNGGSQRIKNNDDIILIEYDDYRKEQKKKASVQHYSKLWDSKKIYKD